MLLFLITSFYLDTGVKGDFIFPYGFNISITSLYNMGIELNFFMYKEDSYEEIFWELRLKKSFLNNTRLAPYIGAGYGERMYMDREKDLVRGYHLIGGLHILVISSSQSFPYRGLYLEPEITAGVYQYYRGLSAGLGIGYRW